MPAGAQLVLVTSKQVVEQVAPPPEVRTAHCLLTSCCTTDCLTALPSTARLLLTALCTISPLARDVMQSQLLNGKADRLPKSQISILKNLKLDTPCTGEAAAAAPRARRCAQKEAHRRAVLQRPGSGQPLPRSPEGLVPARQQGYLHLQVCTLEGVCCTSDLWLW